MPGDLTGETREILQALIRNACVNDGDASSGQEVRNVDTLAAYLGATGIDLERFESAPGRVSLVARLDGRDPDAPSLCLTGHTDVVPVNPSGWDRDPFGGELVDGEVWGRGAVDMLNLTASMAVVFRHLAASGFRPRGDLVFLAVADEESGSRYGASWMAEHHWDRIAADFVLTEGGGTHGGPVDRRVVTFNVAEKGVSWRRLTVRGRPAHGSMPYRRDNALVTAAAVVARLAEHSIEPRLTDLWEHHVAVLDVDDDLRAQLLDPERLDTALASLPDAGTASHLHACSHTTMSCNAVEGEFKTNVIPDRVELQVDVRTLPGEGPDDADAHVLAALGPLADRVEISRILDSPPSASRLDTPLWRSLRKAVTGQFPSVELAPNLHMGFTDARVFRERGVVAYGGGLFSAGIDGAEFMSRFHGNNERVDVASLGATARLFLDVTTDLLA